MISSNSLNVTRVGGITALIGGAGGAALALYGVDKVHDRLGVVVVAYGATGLIVAAALIAVAVIIAADIRARTDLAKAASAPAQAQAHPAVRAVEGRNLTDVKIGMDDDFVVVDAHAGDVEMTLPDPSKFGNRILTLRRTDGSPAHTVTISGGNGFGPEELSNARPEVRVFTVNNGWHLIP